MKILPAILAIIAVISSASSIFLYFKYKNAQSILSQPSIQNQLNSRSWVEKVSQLMVLPQDEEPTIATVSDTAKLKDQPFFKNAKNGDVVLIYTKAQIAILYDPKIDKIIAVAPINLGSTQTPLPTESPLPSKTP